MTALARRAWWAFRRFHDEQVALYNARVFYFGGSIGVGEQDHR